ncbi:MAG: alanine racemase [Campylobacteraceae bacterium]|jgi:alanine racemase|nr:alanine racemase [Campylobacteraceae bacterium]
MPKIKLYSQNLALNLDILAKKAGDKERIIAVLKDNAYGHGLSVFAPKVASLGITHAITREAKEALEIEGFFRDIIVLSEHKEAFFKHPKIIFAVNEFEALKSAPSGVHIALKIDTGMHRNGISADELDSACKLIADKKLLLHSIFTHFRSADEISGEFFWQRKNFNEIKAKYADVSKRYSLPKVYFHSCNSAALLRCNKFDEDFARVGIAMYGYCDLPEAFGSFGLKPVLELFAKRISAKELQKGQRVGYGGVFTSDKNMLSSLYDIGYADGILRYDGKKELRTTTKSLILGRVSMDSMSVNSDEEEISVFNDATVWAKYFNTISYDILVKLNAKISREFA